MPEQILILDFGSQVTQLIARRVRELNVYCEIHPYNKVPTLTPDIKGIILSGSPCSVRENGYPDVETERFGDVPVLGICYGAQLLAHRSGGEVLPSQIREYGRARLTTIDHQFDLLKEVPLDTQVWMSHSDTIASIPDEFEIIAGTSSVKVAAFHKRNSKVYGIQFHPEVTHTTEGKTLLRNFVVHICGCSQDWTPDQFVETTVSELKSKLGDDKVVMALSGGVDSTVAATLIHRAIGTNLHCIFVDNGLLRKDEFAQVLKSYEGMGLNINGVDAKDKFYTALKGLTEPEAKRKAIGRTFIKHLDERTTDRLPLSFERAH